MTAYRQETEQDDGWSRWVQPIERGYKMSCCDCGLVHVLDFRIYVERVQFRARRDKRASAAVRREQRKKEKLMADENSTKADTLDIDQQLRERCLLATMQAGADVNAPDRAIRAAEMFYQFIKGTATVPPKGD